MVNIFHTSAIFHVAAGRGCAKAFHSAIHVATENKTLNAIMIKKKANVSTFTGKLRLNQLASSVVLLSLTPKNLRSIEDIASGAAK